MGHLNRRYESLTEKNDPLVAIAAMVPFESFRPKLNAALIKGELRRSEAERKNSAGRKPWDEVVILKALVLQALYNLSDDQVEYQLRDRFSFMRFLGLELEDAVPDAKTLWLYREALAKAGAVEELFDLFDVFGDQKNGMGAGIVHTIGIVRARCKIGMTNLVYNMHRFVCLERIVAAAA
jgi:hypothetical protein